jgi:hypothetical protein
MVADFDGDGIPDIATSSVVDAPAAASGRGDGTFKPARPLESLIEQGGAVADFNGDGRPDLAFAGVGYPAADVYLNWTGLPAPPCVVVDLTAAPLRIARRILRDSGCRVGRVRHRFSRSVRRNRVIAESERDGAVLPSRSRIDLLVSRGRRR